MTSYCDNLTGSYCERIKKHVPRSWCLDACQYYNKPTPDEQNKQLPSLPQMAVNFGKALVKHAVNRDKRSDDEVRRILSLCKACPSYLEKDGKLRCAHKKCGCFLDKKVAWASESCPEGKWGVEEEYPLVRVNNNVFLDAHKNPMRLTNQFWNQSVFICANGASFKNLDWSKLKQPGIVTFGMNNGAQAFRPNLWSGQDTPGKFMESIWEDPTIMKFTDINNAKKEYAPNKKVSDSPNMVYHVRKSDFNPDTWASSNHISWGLKDTRCSLMATLHICFFLGFKKIYLLGVDWNMTPDNKYFFEQDRTPEAIAQNMKLYCEQSAHLAELYPRLKNLGRQIYNCTAGSKLNVFPFMDFDAAIQEAAIDTSESTLGRYEEQWKPS